MLDGGVSRMAALVAAGAAEAQARIVPGHPPASGAQPEPPGGDGGSGDGGLGPGALVPGGAGWVLLLALGLLAELRDLRRSALAPYLRLLPAPPGSRLAALARTGPPATDLLLFTCGPARRRVLSQRPPAGRARAPAGCQRPPGRRGACPLLPRAQPDAVAAGRARRAG